MLNFFHIALVTDSSVIMQKSKVKSLGLDSVFNLIIYCWDIGAPKSNVKGFELAMSHFKCTSQKH